uniref:vitelline membrane outer layer protein 1-like n=1 Tax=Euleptes europaea TaxID=460621 RepID=UPI002541557A|nr:vitelline membrane outer layer protein 1-like [Euleptes europaea]
MQLTIASVTSLLLSCCLSDVEGRKFISTLSVTNGGKLGDWGEVQSCPKGYVDKFSLKIEAERGAFDDDSSLNGIRLYCTDGSVITSLVGKYGDWSDQQSCKSGFLNSFSLQVSEPVKWADATAADNIKFKCTDGTELEGKGIDWGKYGSWSTSCPKHGICGIQTRVEITGRQPNRDVSGLNDVKFFCCH